MLAASKSSPSRNGTLKARTNAPPSVSVSNVNSHFATSVNTPEVRDKSEILKNLDAEIRSKQRLLQNLNTQTLSIDEKLQEEISNRDKFITILNEQILNMKSAKLELKQQHIKDLDETVEKLRIEVNDLQNENDSLQGAIYSKEAQMVAMKEWFDEEIQSLNSEISNTDKAINDAQDTAEQSQREAADIKSDLIQMAKIVQNMTVINKDLESKINDQNSMVEQANSENFANKIKASSAEEVEQSLVEEINLHAIAQKKIDKIEKSNERLKYEKKLLIDCYEENVDKMKNYEDILMKSVIEEYQALSERYTEIRHAFKMAFGSVQKEDIDENVFNGPRELMNKQREDLINKDIEITKLTRQSDVLQNRIQELEFTIEHQKQTTVKADERKKAQLDVVESSIVSMREQKTNIAQELAKKSQEYNISVAKMADFVSKESLQRGQIEQGAFRINTLEQEVQRLKTRLGAVRSTTVAKENEFRQRERRIKNVVNLVKSYEDELFARDTKLLKKISEMGVEEQLTGRRLGQRHNSSLNRKWASRLKTELTAEKSLPELKSARSWAKLRQHASPLKQSANEPIFELVTNYLGKLDGVKRWKTAKHGQLKTHRNFTKENIPMTDLRTILDAKLPDVLQMTPMAALDHVYGNKVSELKKNLTKYFKGIQNKLQVSDLLEKVTYPKLAEALKNKTEISVLELGHVLVECANE